MEREIEIEQKLVAVKREPPEDFLLILPPPEDDETAFQPEKDGTAMQGMDEGCQVEKKCLHRWNHSEDCFMFQASPSRAGIMEIGMEILASIRNVSNTMQQEFANIRGDIASLQSRLDSVNADIAMFRSEKAQRKGSEVGQRFEDAEEEPPEKISTEGHFDENEKKLKAAEDSSLQDEMVSGTLFFIPLSALVMTDYLNVPFFIWRPHKRLFCGRLFSWFWACGITSTQMFLCFLTHLEVGLRLAKTVSG